MSNLPWTLIAGHGIVLRPSPTRPDSWEYAIPPLSAAWYGPYSTREAARIAALGVEYAYYIDPVLAQARQHFDRLQRLIADQQL